MSQGAGVRLAANTGLLPSRAAFEGTRIILRQNSAESEAIFDLLLELHRLWGSDWSAVPAASGLSEAEVTWFLEYASMVLDNLGNYAVSD